MATSAFLGTFNKRILKTERIKKMEKNFCEIICVIDRSGSMASIQDDAIGGFNTFLEKQKNVLGEATLTLIQFNTEYEVTHENKPIKDIPELDKNTFSPSGMTALLDAVGKTIDNVGRRLSNTPEDNRPTKVILAILTDGEENSSKEMTLSKVKGMIDHQRDKYGWEFIFLGANQDAFTEAAKIGIRTCDTQSFVATGAGVRDAYGVTSELVSKYR